MILGWEGVDAWTPVIFFVVLIQATLLFGLETWVMTPCTVQTLVGFHHHVERCLTGKLPQRRMDGVWYTHPLWEIL